MTRGTVARAAGGAVFLAALLWQVLGAVSDLLLWVGIAAVARGQLSATAWTLLGAGMLVPVVAAAAGLFAARRRSLPGFLLVLAATLCAARALGVTQLATFLQVIGAL